MPKKKRSTRYIPLKNYFITAFMIALAIFLIFYLFEWYKVKNIEKYGTSYLMESNTINLEIKNYEEIPNVLLEASTDYFLFINYLNVKETYKLEKDLKKVIDKYNIQDIFYYMNVTELKDDTDYLKKLNTALNTNNKIKNVPVLLYFSNNELIEVINSGNNKMIQAADLERIIDVYNLAE